MSQRIAVVDDYGRGVLDIAPNQLRGGERVEVVRATPQQVWATVADGHIQGLGLGKWAVIVRSLRAGAAPVARGDWVVIDRPYLGAPGAPPGGTGRVVPPDGTASGAPPPPPPAPEIPISATVGPRFYAGFAGKTAPEVPHYPGEEGKAGFAWAFGLVGTLRAWNHLGFEAGLLSFSSKMERTAQVHGDAEGDVAQTVRGSAWRIPLLVRGVLPLAAGDGQEVRLSLGAGVELHRGRDSELEVQVTPAGQTLRNLGMRDGGGVSPANQRFWVVDVGMEVPIDELVVSVNFRGTYNPDVTEPRGNYLEGETELMDYSGGAGAMLGLAWEFDNTP